MTGSGGVDVLSCHPTPRRADVGGGSGGGGQGQGDYGKVSFEGCEREKG